MAKFSKEDYNKKFALIEEKWNKEKNDEEGIFLEDLRGVTLSNNKTNVWVDCDHCGFPHYRSIGSIVRYTCKGTNNRVHNNLKRYVKDNERLLGEWNFELNKERNHMLESVTMSERKEKFWWHCHKCNENWQATPFVRERSNCPYCAKILINQANSFYELSGAKDRITEESKEVSKTISKSNNIISIGVHCCNCNEVMLGTPNKLMSDLVCECGYKIISCEKSKVRTQKEIEEDYEKSLFKNVFPNLVDKLVDSEVANEVASFQKRYDFYCNCGGTISKKATNMEKTKVTSCKKCRKKRHSYPERLFSSILNELGIEFEREVTFDWLKNRRYDFYLPELNMIIETHGGQHYEEVDHFQMSLSEVKENDKIKMESALGNGIKHYIVIDARISSVKHIKNSVENTKLLELLGNPTIHWEEAGEKALTPPNIEAINYWNNGIHTISEIAKLVGVTIKAIRNYLLEGVELGICDYTKEKSYTALSKNASDRVFRCYNPETDEFVKEFESTREVYQYLFEKGLTKATKENFDKRFRKVLDTERQDGKGYLTLGNLYWKSEKKHLQSFTKDDNIICVGNI